MDLYLKIAGAILMILSVLHIGFPRYFKWKEQLKLLSHINREMMYVHTFFVALMLLLMGLFCITSADEMITTAIGRKISMGFGIFWTLRLFFQFFIYSASHWRGKRFETGIHILFSVLWIYLSVVFLLTALNIDK